LWLLGAIKADLRVGLWILSAANGGGYYILEAIRVTEVWLQHLKEVSDVTVLRRSGSLP
jgi:hypothetical protein